MTVSPRRLIALPSVSSLSYPVLPPPAPPCPVELFASVASMGSTTGKKVLHQLASSQLKATSASVVRTPSGVFCLACEGAGRKECRHPEHALPHFHLPSAPYPCASHAFCSSACPRVISTHLGQGRSVSSLSRTDTLTNEVAGPPRRWGVSGLPVNLRPSLASDKPFLSGVLRSTSPASAKFSCPELGNVIATSTRGDTNRYGCSLDKQSSRGPFGSSASLGPSSSPPSSLLFQAACVLATLQLLVNLTGSKEKDERQEWGLLSCLSPRVVKHPPPGDPLEEETEAGKARSSSTGNQVGFNSGRGLHLASESVCQEKTRAKPATRRPAGPAPREPLKRTGTALTDGGCRVPPNCILSHSLHFHKNEETEVEKTHGSPFVGSDTAEGAARSCAASSLALNRSAGSSSAVSRISSRRYSSDFAPSFSFSLSEVAEVPSRRHPLVFLQLHSSGLFPVRRLAACASASSPSCASPSVSSGTPVSSAVPSSSLPPCSSSSSSCLHVLPSPARGKGAVAAASPFPSLAEAKPSFYSTRLAEERISQRAEGSGSSCSQDAAVIASIARHCPPSSRIVRRLWTQLEPKPTDGAANESKEPEDVRTPPKEKQNGTAEQDERSTSESAWVQETKSLLTKEGASGHRAHAAFILLALLMIQNSQWADEVLLQCPSISAMHAFLSRLMNSIPTDSFSSKSTAGGASASSSSSSSSSFSQVFRYFFQSAPAREEAPHPSPFTTDVITAAVSVLAHLLFLPLEQTVLHPAYLPSCFSFSEASSCVCSGTGAFLSPVTSRSVHEDLSEERQSADKATASSFGSSLQAPHHGRPSAPLSLSSTPRRHAEEGAEAADEALPSRLAFSRWLRGLGLDKPSEELRAWRRHLARGEAQTERSSCLAPVQGKGREEVEEAVSEPDVRKERRERTNQVPSEGDGGSGPENEEVLPTHEKNRSSTRNHTEAGVLQAKGIVDREERRKSGSSRVEKELNLLALWLSGGDPSSSGALVKNSASKDAPSTFSASTCRQAIVEIRRLLGLLFLRTAFVSDTLANVEARSSSSSSSTFCRLRDPSSSPSLSSPQGHTEEEGEGQKGQTSCCSASTSSGASLDKSGVEDREAPPVTTRLFLALLKQTPSVSTWPVSSQRVWLDTLRLAVSQGRLESLGGDEKRRTLQRTEILSLLFLPSKQIFSCFSSPFSGTEKKASESASEESTTGKRTLTRLFSFSLSSSPASSFLHELFLTVQSLAVVSPVAAGACVLTLLRAVKSLASGDEPQQLMPPTAPSSLHSTPSSGRSPGAPSSSEASPPSSTASKSLASSQEASGNPAASVSSPSSAAVAAPSSSSSWLRFLPWYSSSSSGLSNEERPQVLTGERPSVSSASPLSVYIPLTPAFLFFLGSSSLNALSNSFVARRERELRQGDEEMFGGKGARQAGGGDGGTQGVLHAFLVFLRLVRPTSEESQTSEGKTAEEVSAPEWLKEKSAVTSLLRHRQLAALIGHDSSGLQKGLSDSPPAGSAQSSSLVPNQSALHFIDSLEDRYSTERREQSAWMSDQVLGSRLVLLLSALVCEVINSSPWVSSPLHAELVDLASHRDTQEMIRQTNQSKLTRSPAGSLTVPLLPSDTTAAHHSPPFLPPGKSNAALTAAETSLAALFLEKEFSSLHSFLIHGFFDPDEDTETDLSAANVGRALVRFALLAGVLRRQELQTSRRHQAVDKRDKEDSLSMAAGPEGGGASFRSQAEDRKTGRGTPGGRTLELGQGERDESAGGMKKRWEIEDEDARREAWNKDPGDWTEPLRHAVRVWMASQSVSSPHFTAWLEEMVSGALYTMQLQLLEDLIERPAKRAAGTFFDWDVDTILAQTLALLEPPRPPSSVLPSTSSLALPTVLNPSSSSSATDLANAGRREAAASATPPLRPDDHLAVHSPPSPETREREVTCSPRENRGLRNVHCAPTENRKTEDADAAGSPSLTPVVEVHNGRAEQQSPPPKSQAEEEAESCLPATAVPPAVIPSGLSEETRDSRGGCDLARGRWSPGQPSESRERSPVNQKDGAERRQNVREVSLDRGTATLAFDTLPRARKQVGVETEGLREAEALRDGARRHTERPFLEEAHPSECSGSPGAEEKRPPSLPLRDDGGVTPGGGGCVDGATDDARVDMCIENKLPVGEGGAGCRQEEEASSPSTPAVSSWWPSLFSTKEKKPERSVSHLSPCDSVSPVRTSRPEGSSSEGVNVSGSSAKPGHTKGGAELSTREKRRADVLSPATSAGDVETAGLLSREDAPAAGSERHMYVTDREEFVVARKTRDLVASGHLRVGVAGFALDGTSSSRTGKDGVEPKTPLSSLSLSKANQTIQAPAQYRELAGARRLESLASSERDGALGGMRAERVGEQASEDPRERESSSGKEREGRELAGGLGHVREGLVGFHPEHQGEKKTSGRGSVHLQEGRSEGTRSFVRTSAGDLSSQPSLRSRSSELLPSVSVVPRSGDISPLPFSWNHVDKGLHLETEDTVPVTDIARATIVQSILDDSDRRAASEQLARLSCSTATFPQECLWLSGGFDVLLLLTAKTLDFLLRDPAALRLYAPHEPRREEKVALAQTATAQLSESEKEERRTEDKGASAFSNPEESPQSRRVGAEGARHSAIAGEDKGSLEQHGEAGREGADKKNKKDAGGGGAELPSVTREKIRKERVELWKEMQWNLRTIANSAAAPGSSLVSSSRSRIAWEQLLLQIVHEVYVHPALLSPVFAAMRQELPPSSLRLSAPSIVYYEAVRGLHNLRLPTDEASPFFLRPGGREGSSYSRPVYLSCVYPFSLPNESHVLLDPLLLLPPPHTPVRFRTSTSTSSSPPEASTSSLSCFLVESSSQRRKNVFQPPYLTQTRDDAASRSRRSPGHVAFCQQEKEQIVIVPHLPTEHLTHAQLRALLFALHRGRRADGHSLQGRGGVHTASVYGKHGEQRQGKGPVVSRGARESRGDSLVDFPCANSGRPHKDWHEGGGQKADQAAERGGKTSCWVDSYSGGERRTSQPRSLGNGLEEGMEADCRRQAVTSSCSCPAGCPCCFYFCAESALRSHQLLEDARRKTSHGEQVVQRGRGKGQDPEENADGRKKAGSGEEERSNYQTSALPSHVKDAAQEEGGELGGVGREKKRREATMRLTKAEEGGGFPLVGRDTGEEGGIWEIEPEDAVNLKARRHEREDAGEGEEESKLRERRHTGKKKMEKERDGEYGDRDEENERVWLDGGRGRYAVEERQKKGGEDSEEADQRGSSDGRSGEAEAGRAPFVVFLHGLRGSAWRTWRCSRCRDEVCLLPQDDERVFKGMAKAGAREKENKLSATSKEVLNGKENLAGCQLAVSERPLAAGKRADERTDEEGLWGGKGKILDKTRQQGLALEETVPYIFPGRLWCFSSSLSTLPPLSLHRGCLPPPPSWASSPLDCSLPMRSDADVESSGECLTTGQRHTSVGMNFCTSDSPHSSSFSSDHQLVLASPEDHFIASSLGAGDGRAAWQGGPASGGEAQMTKTSSAGRSSYPSLLLFPDTLCSCQLVLNGEGKESYDCSVEEKQMQSSDMYFYLWPRHLLASLFPDSPVLAVDYPAPLFREQPLFCRHPATWQEMEEEEEEELGHFAAEGDEASLRSPESNGLGLKAELSKSETKLTSPLPPFTPHVSGACTPEKMLQPRLTGHDTETASSFSACPTFDAEPLAKSEGPRTDASGVSMRNTGDEKDPKSTCNASGWPLSSPSPFPDSWQALSTSFSSPTRPSTSSATSLATQPSSGAQLSPPTRVGDSRVGRGGGLSESEGDDSLLEVLSSRSGVKLQQIGKCAQQQLQAAGVGVADRPIVFVAHSMGGLLAQYLILHDEGIRRNTRAVLFYGTPLQGSPLAEGEWVKVARSFLPRYVLQLSPADSYRRSLTGAFRRLLQTPAGRHIRVAALGEMQVTKLPYIGRSSLIVPPWSSLPSWLPARPRLLVDVDHTHICKPSTAEDVRFRVLAELLTEVQEESA